jgi:hypothetical protein
MRGVVLMSEAGLQVVKGNPYGLAAPASVDDLALEWEILPEPSTRLWSVV